MAKQRDVNALQDEFVAAVATAFDALRHNSQQQLVALAREISTLRDENAQLRRQLEETGAGPSRALPSHLRQVVASFSDRLQDLLPAEAQHTVRLAAPSKVESSPLMQSAPVTPLEPGPPMDGPNDEEARDGSDKSDDGGSRRRGSYRRRARSLANRKKNTRSNMVALKELSSMDSSTVKDARSSSPPDPARSVEALVTMRHMGPDAASDAPAPPPMTGLAAKWAQRRSSRRVKHSRSRSRGSLDQLVNSDKASEDNSRQSQGVYSTSGGTGIKVGGGRAMRWSRIGFTALLEVRDADMTDHRLAYQGEPFFCSPGTATWLVEDPLPEGLPDCADAAPEVAAESWYRRHFVGRVHINLVTSTPELGPVVISLVPVEPEDSDAASRGQSHARKADKDDKDDKADNDDDDGDTGTASVVAKTTFPSTAAPMPRRSVKQLLEGEEADADEEAQGGEAQGEDAQGEAHDDAHDDTHSDTHSDTHKGRKRKVRVRKRRDPRTRALVHMMRAIMGGHGRRLLRALVRTQWGEQRVLFPVGAGFPLIEGLTQSSMVEQLVRLFNPILAAAPLYIAPPSIHEKLLAYEESQCPCNFKVGVMLALRHQTREEQMLNNRATDGTPAWDDFLSMLGTRVTLRGFSGYAGMLDVRADESGTESLYAKYHQYHIMFHVSTMLPHSEHDEQQVSKKRYIGNDITTIIFHDWEEDAEPIELSTLVSQFIQVVLAVRPAKCADGSPGYQVAAAYRQGVPLLGPFVPLEPMSPSLTRSFLLNKIVNSEISSCIGPSFVTRLAKVRTRLLDDIVQPIMGSTT